MITRLRIENFRSHQQTDFTLEPLTVFVGPCASGKSNIFGALALLQSTTDRPLNECFGSGIYDFGRVRSLWLKGSESIGMEADVSLLRDFPGWKARYRVAVTKGGDLYQVTGERLDAEEPEENGGRKITCFDRKWSADDHPPFGRVKVEDPTLLAQSFGLGETALADERVCLMRAMHRSISRLGYFRPDPEAVHTASTVEESLWPGYRGENMAACLNYLRLSRPDAFDAVVDRLKGFLPGFEEIELHRDSPGRWSFSFRFRDFVETVPAALLSDGTKLSLAYLVISALATPPLILCLEEPENGYHPRRLKDLMDILVTLAYPTDGTEPVQVLVSTHSPYLLDFFCDDLEKCIRIVEMHDGRTEIAEWLARKAERTPHPTDADDEVPVGDLWAQGLYGGV